LPPQLKDPSTGAYEGLGYRIPLIVVSPFAKHGYVSHERHEIASTLHFIETTFGLPSLGLADQRADDLSDMFDFTQKPAAFHALAGTRPAGYFIDQTPSLKPPDD
jgi:phospholipase C